jgi:hypothetical protein
MESKPKRGLVLRFKSFQRIEIEIKPKRVGLTCTVERLTDRRSGVSQLNCHGVVSQAFVEAPDGEGGTLV